MEIKRSPLFTSLVFVCLCLSSSRVFCKQSLSAVHSFERSLSDAESRSADDGLLNILRKRRSPDVTETESEKDDPKCLVQQMSFKEKREDLKNGGRLEETHVFVNESKFNLALAWAGSDDLGHLLVLTTDVHFLAPAESTLWRSTDNGRNWEDWTSHVDNKVFRKDDGLQRNPHNPQKVYLISYEHYIYVTENGGESWTKSLLTKDEGKDISVEEELEFHPEPAYENYVAAISSERKLYVTYENFQGDPKPIKENVHSVKWGSVENSKEKCLYVTIREYDNPLITIGPVMMRLERFCEGQWTPILERVLLFDVQGKFIYASIFKSDKPKTQEDDRLMMISSDGGDTWNEAQLPTLAGDRFFSVLDMSEGLIFMHVDNPGDTGHGVLYTSSSDGIVYSESLRNHLFPNYNTVHDFYKIESIRGVYLASQMADDKSIHTVITYNRGGEWKNVSRPVGVKCENDEKEGCFLQIHNAYSIHRGIKARMPNSQKEALGLVLVHAHVASNLQTTPPDVFLSTDGGYNFKKVLSGPHAYEIADSGGLLVAVPLDTDYPKIVKFSTDEGNCWHTYQFTTDDIKFTGLLTEPGGKSMTVLIWGYHKETKKWTINIIDFNTVVTKECKDDDYVDWTPHTSLQTKPGYEGCLLGQKETFKRIKPDSWCRNGYEKAMEVTRHTCKCTEEDYECDYGFYRPEGATKCIRQPEIKAKDIDICKKGHFEKLLTLGYRLIPGDVCDAANGFHPTSDLDIVDINCSDGDQKAVKHDESPPPENTGSSKILIVALVLIVLILVAVVGAFFTYKLVLLRRHKVVYRYSMLNQTDADRDNEFENALTSHDTLYRDSSDEEVEQENRSPQHHGTNGSVLNKDRKPAVKSYHDDSDDDMLG